MYNARKNKSKPAVGAGAQGQPAAAAQIPAPASTPAPTEAAATPTAPAMQSLSGLSAAQLEALYLMQKERENQIAQENDRTDDEEEQKN